MRENKPCGSQSGAVRADVWCDGVLDYRQAPRLLLLPLPRLPRPSLVFSAPPLAFPPPSSSSPFPFLAPWRGSPVRPCGEAAVRIERFGKVKVTVNTTAAVTCVNVYLELASSPVDMVWCGNKL